MILCTVVWPNGWGIGLKMIAGSIPVTIIWKSRCSSLQHDVMGFFLITILRWWENNDMRTIRDDFMTLVGTYKNF